MLYNLRKKKFYCCEVEHFRMPYTRVSKLELCFLLIFAHYEIFGYDTLFHYR